jgi:hypothetical protein
MLKFIFLSTAVVLISIAVVVTAYFPRQGNESQTNIKLKTQNNLQRYGVEIVGPDDAGFETELEKYFGSNQDALTLVDTAKPFTIFIKNRSTQEVVGLSLRWELVKSTGEVNVIPQTQNNVGVLFGPKTVDPLLIGKTSIINAGDSKFFSYFPIQPDDTASGMRASIGASTGTAPTDVGSLTAQARDQKGIMLNGVSTVSLSIDGLFFDDGTFIGENKGFYFEQIEGEIKAERDILKRFSEAATTGKSEADIIAEFIADTPEHVIPPRNVLYGRQYETAEQAFDLMYRGALSGKRKAIDMMRRTNWSDARILASFTRAKDSDFKELWRIDQ